MCTIVSQTTVILANKNDEKDEQPKPNDDSVISSTDFLSERIGGNDDDGLIRLKGAMRKIKRSQRKGCSRLIGTCMNTGVCNVLTYYYSQT